MFIAYVRVTADSKWRPIGCADTESDALAIAKREQTRYQARLDYRIDARVMQATKIAFSATTESDVSDLQPLKRVIAPPVVVSGGKVDARFTTVPLDEVLNAPKPRRGRQPGSKNRPKWVVERERELKAQSESDSPPRRKGRPPGSKNKAKEVVYA